MFFARFLHKGYAQGQHIGKIREYFYYISHEGFLFLHDSRMKNFTAAYRDQDFLDFFYKHLISNESGRYSDFPYISRCGRERNYLSCDDRPIVFTEVVNGGNQLRIGESRLTFPLMPSELCMLANGRLYHPAPFAKFGLVKSALADSTFFRQMEFDAEGYPSVVKWDDQIILLSQNIRKDQEPQTFN